MLACAAVIIAFAGRWFDAPLTMARILLSFSAFGAFHACIVVATTRLAHTIWRALGFVAVAACLAALTVMLSVYGIRFSGAFPGGIGFSCLLALTSALGAASYAAVIRRYWIPRMPVRLLGFSMLACALATLTASRVPSANLAELRYAVGWWFAFSTALWYQDGK